MVLKKCWHDGGDDDEYNGVGPMEISKIAATQEEYFIKTELFDRVYVWVWHIM